MACSLTAFMFGAQDFSTLGTYKTLFGSVARQSTMVHLPSILSHSFNSALSWHWLCSRWFWKARKYIPGRHHLDLSYTWSPSEQNQRLVTACSKPSRFPKLRVPPWGTSCCICKLHIDLWVALSAQRTTATMLLIALWIIRATVSDPGVPYLLPHQLVVSHS